MENNQPPKLVKRSLNRKSTIQSGRTIGEKRERLETASERANIHKKAKLKRRLRFIFATIGFVLAIIATIFVFKSIVKNSDLDSPMTTTNTITVPLTPTIEIFDEDTKSADNISGRIKEFVAQIEADLREYGLIPKRAVIPAGAIREIDIYLDGYTGFIKTFVDRGAGVSAEDADRMIRYIKEKGITDFQYIDVRIDGKAYWK